MPRISVRHSYYIVVKEYDTGTRPLLPSLLPTNNNISFHLGYLLAQCSFLYNTVLFQSIRRIPYSVDSKEQSTNPNNSMEEYCGHCGALSYPKTPLLSLNNTHMYRDIIYIKIVTFYDEPKTYCHHYLMFALLFIHLSRLVLISR